MENRGGAAIAYFSVMTRSTPALLLAAGLALAAGFAAAGCGDEDSASTGPGGGAGGPAGEGLPCDVVEVLQDRCWACHGATPAQGVPASLVSHADLAAPAKSDPTKTMAELSVERMKSTAAPMPPGGGVTAAEIAVIEAWAAAGAPKGSCDGAGGGPFSGDVVCTSGKTWTFGTDVSDAMRTQMYPGQACIACHSDQTEETPPIFLVAGTVYPTGHEPDDCFGIDGTALADVIVRVTDSQGRVYELPVNASGNFFLEEGPFDLPYSAAVVSSKGERAMAEEQTSGDCNLCHTEQGGGNGSAAPGRIVVPW